MSPFILKWLKSALSMNVHLGNIAINLEIMIMRLGYTSSLGYLWSLIHSNKQLFLEMWKRKSWVTIVRSLLWSLPGLTFTLTHPTVAGAAVQKSRNVHSCVVKRTKVAQQLLCSIKMGNICGSSQGSWGKNFKGSTA